MLRRIVILTGILLLPTLAVRGQLWNAEDPAIANDPNMKTMEAMFPDAFRHPTRDFFTANGKALAEDMKQFQENAQQTNQAFADTRRRFWASYPNGATHATDAAELSKGLFGKDIYYLTLDLFPDAQRGQLNLLLGQSLYIDDSIPISASREWYTWTSSIKNRLNNENIGLADVVSKILEALADCAPEYGRYVVARDWAEIDAGQVKLPPGDYAMMLVQRCPQAKLDVDAEADFQAMASVFGADRLKQTAAQVQNLEVYGGSSGYYIPANALGKLGIIASERGYQLDPTPAGTVAISSQKDRSYPFDLWLALLAQSGGRSYLTLQIAYDRWSRSHASDLSRLPWAESIAEVNRIIASYGEPAVLAMIDKVRAATQSKMPGHVIGSDLGITSCTNATAVKWLLARADAEGFARLIVAEHNAKSPDAPADLAALETTNGKDKVLAATASVAQTMISGNSYTTLGAKDDDAYEALQACLTPHAANDPYYIAWSKWPVGSRAIYHHLWLNSDGASVMADDDIALVLSATSPQAVTLIRTERNSEHPEDVHVTTVQIGAWHEPNAQGEVLTDMHPTENLYPDIPFQKAVIGADVTLHLANQDIACHQLIDRTQYNGILQLFVSDNVPGMLVDGIERRHERTNSTNDIHLIAFQRGAGTAPGGAFTEWPASIDANQPAVPDVDPAPPKSVAHILAPSPAPAPVFANAPAPNTQALPNTYLKQLTGKSTGSSELDARIIRDYDKSDDGLMPEEVRNAIRREMWIIFHKPGPLSSYDTKRLVYDCGRLERDSVR